MGRPRWLRLLGWASVGRTSLVLDQSVIEDSYDLGLRVDEACATATNTTIRRVGGETQADPNDPDRS